MGVVRVWHPDEGWGVLDLPETVSGCWCHFSVVDMVGYRELRAGQRLEFDWKPADQDGYDYRASRARAS